jgi:hypothetical protein
MKTTTFFVLMLNAAAQLRITLFQSNDSVYNFGSDSTSILPAALDQLNSQVEPER